jgi:hypothetical protein
MFGMSNFASKLLGKRRSAVNREEGAPARAMAERTVALGQVWSQVSQQINERDPEDWNLWHWLQDLYYDAGELFAVTISAGRLYRWPVTVVGDLVTLGDPVAVVVEFAESSERVIERVATRPPGLLSRAVRQTRDGRWIGCSILCTATVNKMGILDSRQLFDSFVERFVGDGTEWGFMNLRQAMPWLRPVRVRWLRIPRVFGVAASSSSTLGSRCWWRWRMGFGCR